MYLSLVQKEEPFYTLKLEMMCRLRGLPQFPIDPTAKWRSRPRDNGSWLCSWLRHRLRRRLALRLVLVLVLGAPTGLGRLLAELTVLVAKPARTRLGGAASLLGRVVDGQVLTTAAAGLEVAVAAGVAMEPAHAAPGLAHDGVSMIGAARLVFLGTVVGVAEDGTALGEVVLGEGGALAAVARDALTSVDAVPVLTAVPAFELAFIDVVSPGQAVAAGACSGRALPGHRKLDVAVLVVDDAHVRGQRVGERHQEPGLEFFIEYKGPSDVQLRVSRGAGQGAHSLHGVHGESIDLPRM